MDEVTGRERVEPIELVDVVDDDDVVVRTVPRAEMRRDRL
jgi:hypothetical protein